MNSITDKTNVHPEKLMVEVLRSRREVVYSSKAFEEFFRGKSVLVTGGAGSIGSQLCRFLLTLPVKQVIALDINENDLYLLERELEQTPYGEKFLPRLGSVRDSQTMEWFISKHRPQIVYHCAAHKHVPSMEISPCEGIKNNVLGTLYLANACKEHGVSCFMLVSTDKAVNPTSVMGATKAVAERIVGAFSQLQSQTRMCAVRFGNVLGSKGSVLPLLQKQIEGGGPVRLTHPQMHRYFMTAEEAVMLIAQATAMEDGGDIFTLDMGEQISMEQFACELIRLYGYKPYEEIGIQYTGIRKGEKLWEELAWKQEDLIPTAHPHIYKTQWGHSNPQELFSDLEQLSQVAMANDEIGCTRKLWEVLHRQWEMEQRQKRYAKA